MIKEVGAVEFDGLRGKGLVLADFFSTTCGPCKMLSFVLADAEGELGDDVAIVKIDFDKNPDLVEEFCVKGYPTLVLLRDGVEVARATGLRQKPEIVKMVESARK